MLDGGAGGGEKEFEIVPAASMIAAADLQYTRMAVSVILCAGQFDIIVVFDVFERV